MSARGRLLCAFAAAPLAAMVAMSLTMFFVWRAEDVTLSEAVATGNLAEVVRLIHTGVDPNTRMRVRGELIGQRHDRVLTPLEAAVVSGLPEMFRLVLEEGATPDPRALQELRCLNVDRSPEIASLLDRMAPSPPGADCRP